MPRNKKCYDKNVNIYLIRHGETDWNKNGILMGQTDVPLNANGKKQAAEAANILSGVDFDICYTSPLSRARETAEIICVGKVKIIEDSLLMERNCGKYAGLDQVNWDECKKDADTESDEKLFGRAKTFAEKLEHINAQNVLVVSHSGLLKNLLHVLEDGGFENFDWELCNNFKKNCGFVVVQKNF